MIHVVTLIITTLILWKKFSKGFPSSPHMAMATPVTMEKTTKPRMFVLFDQAPLNIQVFLSVVLMKAPVAESF